MRYRKNAFTPEEKKFLFRGKCVLKKSKMKWKREEDWIDYDLDVAFTKLQLEKIIQKRYKLDHQEKMILQWLLEEDMEPKVCEAIRVILEMDV